MRFANIEVFEHYFVWFPDKSRTLEYFGTDFLNFCHVIAMSLSGKIEMPFFFLSQSARVDYFVAVIVVLSKGPRLGVFIIHFKY